MTLRLALALAFALALAPSAGASAQARASATILRTHVGDGVGDATARGFDRVLRDRVDALEVVEIAGSVELDLESVQLALGCMGESVECLRSAATQAGSEVLVFGSIESSGSIVVSVMRFDATEGRLRRAVRTVATEAEVLAAAEPLARELWELPPVETPTGPDPGPVTTPSRSLSAGPIVLLGVGGAALVGGLVATLLGIGSADAYRSSRPSTPAQVDQTLSLLEQAQSQQLAGAILLAVGGACAAAGAIWLLAAGNEDGSSPLALLPAISPDGATLVLAGSLGGGL